MAELCKLHGWTEREGPRRVFDAVIFSNEVDILEIRMRELMPFVTKFLVMESNATFTGQRKPLYFKENESRYNFAQSKIQHFFLPSRPYKPNENPFSNEHNPPAAELRRLAGNHAPPAPKLHLLLRVSRRPQQLAFQCPDLHQGHSIHTRPKGGSSPGRCRLALQLLLPTYPRFCVQNASLLSC